MTMNIKVLKYLLAIFCGVLVPIRDGFAVTGRLRPQDFNKMYHLAALGKVGI